VNEAGLSNEQLEELLERCCHALYERGGKRIMPLYPWVLVRTLPKERKVSGIWVPEKTDTVLYQGIVLAIYKPFQAMGKKGQVYPKICPLEVGQRVTFHYSEGMPVPGLDEKYYRLVRVEVDQQIYPRMGVLGTVDYHGDQQLPEKLKELFKDVTMVEVDTV
jgi:co-chaperonin GroES (HSP10)